MTFVAITGSDTVETLPVNESTSQGLEKLNGNATQNLTIWSRLQGKTKGGDGRCRGHKRKDGHDRSQCAGSYRGSHYPRDRKARRARTTKDSRRLINQRNDACSDYG